MADTPPPFARFEWMIAWRYLRAGRTEGGVSVMSWISLVGIALAVFALIATLAVRSGFRAEFVDTILGANAHVTVYGPTRTTEAGGRTREITDYRAMAARVAGVAGVARAAPLVTGQVMVAFQGRTGAAQVFGIAPEDLAAIPRIADPERSRGSLSDFPAGIAIGSGIAQAIGAQAGDVVRLISPDGVRTAFGTSPRVKAYEITYIFTAGRYDIDRTRIYMPFSEAQAFFNSTGAADEIEVMLNDPENVQAIAPRIAEAAGAGARVWTWRDASGAFLRALTVEDNVMFVIMAILVLIAAMNIVSGLIMLVRNKGGDIGILRTMGLSEGSILRIFFLCGAALGLAGTAAGVVMGVLFAIYIDPIFSAVNTIAGGGVWDPSIRGIYELPAKLEAGDVLSAVALSLGLSFTVTYFPARRAARLDPVEALRDG